MRPTLTRLKKAALFAPVTLFTLVGTVSWASAQTQPASRPTAGEAAKRVGGERQASRVLQNLRAAVSDLDLTKDQKEKIDAAFSELREKVKAGATSREELRTATEGLRQKLIETLTPAQRESVREKLQKAFRGEGPAGKSPDAATTKPAGTGDAMMGDDSMKGSDSMKGAEPMKEAGTNKGGDTMPAGDSAMTGGMARDAKTPPGPPQTGGIKPARGPSANAHPIAEVGAAAPEIHAKKLDGTSFSLANIRNRPVVLVFASFSAPTFRDKAALLEDLARDYKGRMDVIVIYTAEAFPSGSGATQIERNRDDKVAIEPHKTEAERFEQAKMAKTVLKLAAPVFLIDDLSNETATGYADTPNAAVVVGRDGAVIGRQKWLEPFSLRGIMDEAVRMKPKAGSSGNDINGR